MAETENKDAYNDLQKETLKVLSDIWQSDTRLFWGIIAMGETDW